MSAASSGVALGKIPGSVKLVLSREMITNTNSTPPITGMKTVRCSTRNGQLWSGTILTQWQVEWPVCSLKTSVMLLLEGWTRYSLECKEKATCDNNKNQSHGEDTTLSGQDESSITEKPVFAGEHFPFFPRPLRCLPNVVLRGRRRHWQRPRIDLLVLAVLHGVNKIGAVRR